MLRYLLPLSLSALLFACDEDDRAPSATPGNSEAPGTIGGDPGSDGESDDSSDVPEDEGGDPEGQKMALSQVDDPCENDDPSEDEEESDDESDDDDEGLLDDLLGGDDEGDEDGGLLEELLGDDDENDEHDGGWDDDEDDLLDILEFDDEGNLFAGCGDEEGLYEYDEDSGEFELLSEFESANVFNLFLGESGDLYIVGNSESSFVSRLYSSGEDEDGDGELDFLTETVLDLSLSLDAEYAEDSCGDSSSLSLSGDNETLLWSSGLLSYSSDDWDEDSGSLTSELFAESTSHLMFSLTASEREGECYGAGQSEDGHPTVYEEDEGFVLDILFESMATIEFEEREGYFGDIEEGDGGMFAVGQDTSSGLGLVYTCEGDCDDEDSWSELDLDLDGEIWGEVSDIDFDDEDGAYGCMVGSEQGSTDDEEDGGWAAYTEDGGQTWQSIDEDMPQMRNCSIDSDGRFILSGALDFVVTGDIDES